MHARARRDVAARPVFRGDCGGQQPQTLPRTPDWPSGAGRTLRLAFRGPAMPSAVTACAWRLLTGTGYTPGPPPGTDTVHGAPGPGHPPPARRRPPCHTDRAAASRSPSHRRPSRPGDRTLMPESPLTSNTAASPHGRPGRVPDLRTPGRPRRLARPATVRPRSPPPSAHRPSRGRTGCTPGPAAAVEPRTGRRGSPSVAVRGKPTVHTDRPGGRTPSAMCPWTPRHRDLQRYKVTHDGTRRKRPG